MPPLPQRTGGVRGVGPLAPAGLPQREERLLRAVRRAPRGRPPPSGAQAPRLAARAGAARPEHLQTGHRPTSLRPAPGHAPHRVRAPQRRRAAAHARGGGGLVGPGALPLAAPARSPGAPLRRDQGLGQLPAAQSQGLGAHATAADPGLQPRAAGATGRRGAQEGGGGGSYREGPRGVTAVGEVAQPALVARFGPDPAGPACGRGKGAARGDLWALCRIGEGDPERGESVLGS